MYSRVVQLAKLGPVTIRPLADRDTATVSAIFSRLGPESRVRRFNGAKPRLSAVELETLARVDGRRHALVAYVAGDREPAGFAQLVRSEQDRGHAEIALAVADPYQRRGIGSALLELLAADARAAGVTHLTATMQSSNDAGYALFRKLARRVDVRHRAGEATLVAAISTV
jgi:ribosomal protein S18 acetylase RimI-like enzyme